MIFIISIHVWLKAWPVPVTLHLSLSPCTAFLPQPETSLILPTMRQKLNLLRNCCADFAKQETETELIHWKIVVLPLHSPLPLKFPRSRVFIVEVLCVFIPQWHTQLFPSQSCFQHTSGPPTPSHWLFWHFPGPFLGWFLKCFSTCWHLSPDRSYRGWLQCPSYSFEFLLFWNKF